MTEFRTAAILVAAGSGTRAGGSVPKQYAQLGGRPLIAYAHQALATHPKIDAVLTVIGAGQEALLGAALGTTPFVTGGATRRESVAAGLEALIAGAFTHVLIHDAARPFLAARVIDDLLTSLGNTLGAAPALPVADTLVRGDGDRIGETVARDNLYRIQTPQAFDFPAILEAHRRWPADREATDDVQMLRAIGGHVALVHGDPMLEKITHPADFAAAEARLASAMRVRTATGYDVHRLVQGEALWLGGVRIPHSHGLSGHSDADVALHAITDALLGTIGAGDIGMHFPPSDPQWRGAASARFLEHAATLVATRGGIVDFIDLTLICEAPKIGPHRDAIRASIAAILGLDPGQVSVKATTTEKLGFTGRGEGMAAQAIATIRMPGTN